jgi:hypothetical protein
MSRLSQIAAQETLREFAQGAAQDAVMPIASFLAPEVNVPVPVGKFKVYTAKNRYRRVNTRRAIGGRAVELGFDADDGTYNCTPHAIDCPIDVAEQEASMEDALREAAGLVADAAALDHEIDVVAKAIASVGAGTDKNWGSGGTNPITDIDTAVLAVLLAAGGMGSNLEVGLLFGALAWQQFKNNSNVSGKFVVGNKATKAQVAVPTLGDIGELFVVNCTAKASYMVYDTAAEGLPASYGWLLERAVIPFLRRQSPNRRDPSFMKTFRLAGRYMVPGTYSRDDGRVEVAKFDWSEDVQVANAAAAARLNGNAS